MTKGGLRTSREQNRAKDAKSSERAPLIVTPIRKPTGSRGNVCHTWKEPRNRRARSATAIRSHAPLTLTLVSITRLRVVLLALVQPMPRG
jgi:hypothetical protein